MSLQERTVGVEGDDASDAADATQPAASSKASFEASVAAGSTIGRYVVLYRLGTGAMGVVYAAFDPELDRKVALKLLKPIRRDREVAQKRLQREARALAKLVHPHVVSVHDVGTHDDRLFVAMEFVDGTTVADWMRECPRPWKEVLDVFVQAGRGLTAAHESGLVHRDVKPENMMLDRRGNVRVMDFGLARGGESDPSVARPDEEPEEPSAMADLLGPSLTRTGALTGTPAYMAPEQFTGDRVDARSDQFGFCVSLYEALYGHRPFIGNSVAELSRKASEGEVTEPLDTRGVPAWLHRAVTRGLAVEPDKRWPSMARLIDELASRRRPRRWTRAAWGVGLVGLGGLAVLVWARPDAPRPCDDAARHLEGVWDDARRAAVRQGLTTAGGVGADATATRVIADLDRRTSEWVATRTTTCEATRVHGEQSELMMDRRMGCLDRRLAEIDALARIFAEADAEVVQRATTAVAGLESLEACQSDDETVVGPSSTSSDPEVAARLARLDRQRSELAAMRLTGRYRAGLELADALVTDAEGLGLSLRVADAKYIRAQFRLKGGDYAGTEADATDAYRTALFHNHRRLAADAANSMLFLLGYVQPRAAEARVWGVQAQVLGEALASDETLATTYNGLALTALSEGNYAEARRLHEQAIAHREAIEDDTPVALAISYNNLGVAAYREGDLEAAKKSYERALQLRREVLEPDHPSIAESLNNLGGLAASRGDFDTALSLFERALEIRLRALGPDHPDVAASHDNLGMVLQQQGKLDEAAPHFQRAFELFEAKLGPDHPTLALTHRNLANLARDRGHRDEALRHLKSALRIRELVQGSEHPETASSLKDLAEAYAEQGEPELALDYAQRAVAVYEVASGADARATAAARAVQASILLDLGRDDEARVAAEAAVAALGEDDPRELAGAKFVLARAQWSDEPRAAAKARSRATAQEARKMFDEIDAEAFVATVDDWLAEHGE